MKYLNLQNQTRKKTGRIAKKFTKLLTVVGIIILGLFILILFKGPGESFRFIFQNGPRSTDGRVNILLLGNAGGVHDGGQLTDTIMVASYNLKTNKVYLISLPRDIWLTDIKGKINSVYEIGESRAKSSGLSLSKKTIGDILGLPIHYGVRVDFSGFTKAVDLLGGIDVIVEKSFEDSLYPIEGRENDLCGLEEKEMDFSPDEAKKLNIDPGKRVILKLKDGKIATDSAEPDKGYQYFSCRYETVSFTAGQTHMDGAIALKFVRSRMGTNSEGSDFARSHRQQLVLESFRKKALSLQTFSSPSKVSTLFTTFGQSFETDVPAGDMPALFGLTKKVGQTQNLVLSTDGSALLTHPPQGDFGGAWVLVPKLKNYDEIHKFIQKVLREEVSIESSGSARTGN